MPALAAGPGCRAWLQGVAAGQMPAFQRRLGDAMSSVDALKSMNGLHASTAQVTHDAATDEIVVRDDVGVGEGFTPVSDVGSTTCTILGTFSALAILVLLATLPIARFLAFDPDINEVFVDQESRAEHVPEIAITLSVPGWSEARILDHLWPELTMVTITDGMSNRSDAYQSLDVSYGSTACSWAGGYNKHENSTTPDGGPALWPVFCLRKAQIDSLNLSLGGRFGDPVYSLLSIRLQHCGQGSGLSPNLAAAWATHNPSQMCEPSKLSGWEFEHIGLNVWFRFPYEDWKTTLGSITQAPKVHEPEGMVQGWTWWIYELLSPLSPSVLTVYLRQNTATITKPLSFPDLSAPDTVQWFDWSGYSSTPTGTSSGQLSTAPLFSASVEVAARARKVNVRYLSLQEVVSSISGSWAICITFGIIVALIAQGCSNYRTRRIAGRRARPQRGHAIKDEAAFEVERQETVHRFTTRKRSSDSPALNA